MRIWTTIAVVAAMLAGISISVRAEAETVTGELITVMCFTGNGEKGRGEDHAACALKCAKEGYPLAVLADDGTLYKLTGPLTADNSVALQDMLATSVVVVGEIGTEGNGKTLHAASVEPAH